MTHKKHHNLELKPLDPLTLKWLLHKAQGPIEYLSIVKKNGTTCENSHSEIIPKKSCQ